MVFEILGNYTFQIVAIGTMVLGATAGMVGSLSVLKGQSLVGDTIGHSSFAGVVLAFILFHTRDPIVLAIGAFISGIVAYYTIHLIHQNSSAKLDNILALVLSSYFAIGMVLKSYIQGNPNYLNASQSGLQTYIFGQAAYIMKTDVLMIIAVSLFAMLVFVLFFKEFKLLIFDEAFAKTIGKRTQWLNLGILLISTALIAVGLKAVGAILISSMLIVPTVIGMQWSNQFQKVIIIAGISGAFSAFLGTFISTSIRNIPTGPSIIVVMSIFAIVSFIWGTNSTLRIRRRRNMKGGK